eukprot:jgi/Chlat1/7194/Chrsp57S06753
MATEAEDVVDAAHVGRVEAAVQPLEQQHQQLQEEGRMALVRVKRKRSAFGADTIILEELPPPEKRCTLAASMTALSVGFDQRAEEAAPATPSPAFTAAAQPTGRRRRFRRVDTIALQHDGDTSIADQVRQMVAQRSERRASTSARLEPKKLVDDRIASAMQQHEKAAKAARYEVIKRRRQSRDAMGVEDNDLFRLYDVIQMDDEEEGHRRAREERKRQAALAEGSLMCNYLPLLRQHAPEAATDIEQELSKASTMHEDYVYDYYLPVDGPEPAGISEDAANIPIVQIDHDPDGRYYGAELPDSDHDSEDSNAESNPANDYPEEESECEPDMTQGAVSDADDSDFSTGDPLVDKIMFRDRGLIYSEDDGYDSEGYLAPQSQVWTRIR